MAPWVSQRRFDKVFHIICYCTRKMFYMHFTIRTYFPSQFQVQTFYYAVTWNCDLFCCSCFPVFFFFLHITYFFSWFSISFCVFYIILVDYILLFFFFDDASFAGRHFRKILVCRFVPSVIVGCCCYGWFDLLLCTDIVFPFCSRPSIL